MILEHLSKAEGKAEGLARVGDVLTGTWGPRVPINAAVMVGEGTLKCAQLWCLDKQRLGGRQGWDRESPLRRAPEGFSTSAPRHLWLMPDTLHCVAVLSTV